MSLNRILSLFLASTSLLLCISVKIFSMESSQEALSLAQTLDQVERGVDPIIQIKIWAKAVEQLNKEVTAACKAKQTITEEKTHEFNVRKNDLIGHLTSIQRAHPSLFIGCPHILTTITRLNTATRAQMSPEQLGALLKTLGALQGNLEPILKAPEISPCLKNTAVAFSVIGGGLLTLTGITYAIIEMIDKIKGW